VVRRDCDRETEVVAAAGTGAIDSDLRAHLDTCESCRDLFEVARAVVEDRGELMSEAHPPGAGLMWWRVTMRERREAARTAARAGSFIQFVLVVAAVFVALAFLGVTIDVHAVWQSIASSAKTFALPLMALAAWLILAPAAVFFVTRDGRAAR
jgi:predicted anti-sigma-YlaC factor YlaD